jgi:RNA polymerase sigma factor (sigma-70 family)
VVQSYPLVNPLADEAPTDVDDLQLVERARAGSRDALGEILARHQRWIYNVVLRMVYFPQDAEDVTQEILIKVCTKLSTFEGRSTFRTWLYRIAVNHVLNMKRRRGESLELTFTEYGRGLDNTPDAELPEASTLPVDTQVIVDEARIGCTSGMLLCLDREQRIVYVLGAIFGVTDSTGAELLEITPSNFRQKLSRARRDLHHFMSGQCGLIDPLNPCRCAKKTRGFMNAGYLDPNKLLFAGARVEAVRDVAEARSEAIDALDAAYAGIHRDHPFQSSPDFRAALRELLSGEELKRTLDLN